MDGQAFFTFCVFHRFFNEFRNSCENWKNAIKKVRMETIFAEIPREKRFLVICIHALYFIPSKLTFTFALRFNLFFFFSIEWQHILCELFARWSRIYRSGFTFFYLYFSFLSLYVIEMFRLTDSIHPYCIITNFVYF